jgi:hypothetical protein
MNKFKKIITFIVCLVLPVSISFWFLNLLGHQISRKAKIGFSFLLLDKLIMDKNTRIGHFNFIVDLIDLKTNKNGYLGYGNFLKGPFSVL